MKTSEYAQMAKREQSYWWHLGRIDIVKTQLLKLYSGKKIKILNVGCGTGGTVSTLKKFGEVTNIDVSKEALKFLKNSGHEGTLFDGVTVPFKDESFDLVIALDVLEHIELDQQSLLEWKRVLKKNGKMFITVPAYEWLWSGHDISLHHQRRYTTSKLTWDLEKIGVKTLKRSYAIGFSLPLVAGFRLLHKLSGKYMNEKSSYVNLPNVINSLFTCILRFESRWLSRFNLPAGTTVFGIFLK